jgi:hypothetical protein
MSTQSRFARRVPQSREAGLGDRSQRDRVPDPFRVPFGNPRVHLHPRVLEWFGYEAGAAKR